MGQPLPFPPSAIPCWCHDFFKPRSAFSEHNLKLGGSVTSKKYVIVSNVGCGMWVKPVFSGWDRIGILISKFEEKPWDIDIKKITVSHCHHIACITNW